MFRILIAMAAIAAAGCAGAPARTQVMVIGSLHQMHDGHPHYDYEALYQTVRDFKPDWVGVEIRPEDMALSDAEKAQIYPPEMIALANAWKDRAFGFDWLGGDLEGRPLQQQYMRETMLFKQAEQRLANDPAYSDPAIEAILGEQMTLISESSAAALNDGRYDRLQAAFSEALAVKLAGTDYQIVPDFRRRRDERIDANIVAWLRQHPGSRVVVVMGLAHRVFAVQAIERDADAVIVPVP